jgi:hypothetical protein
MAARMETGDEFSGFIDFPSSLPDDGYELQSDFLNASWDGRHQEELFWNVPNALENHALENQPVGNQPVNDSPLHRQGGLSLFPPPAGSKPRRQRLNKFQKTCLNNWLLAHQSHPYPTAGEFASLAALTLLTEKQVRTWFNNARSRKSVQGK